MTRGPLPLSDSSMSPSETSATMGVIASAPVVRGRDAELAAIRVQLDRVRSGAGAAVLVEGEPGMGKSRLLAESARIARRLGFRVGTGVAEPNTRAVELAPLMTALFDGPDPLLNRPTYTIFGRSPSSGTGCCRSATSPEWRPGRI